MLRRSISQRIVVIVIVSIGFSVPRSLGKEVIGEKGVFGEVGARGIDSKCTTLRARACALLDIAGAPKASF